MVNKYFLALLLTFILVLLGFSFTRWADEQRLIEFKNSFDEAYLDYQSVEQLLLYESLFSDNEHVCPVIRASIDHQIAKLRGLLFDLEVAQKQNVFSNFEVLKRKYHFNNLQLYLLIRKAIDSCGYSDLEPVLFFYSDKENCPECIVQGRVLDSLTSNCSNLRVFAIPYDFNIPLISVLKEKNSVTKVPAVIVNGKKYVGLVSGNKLLEEGLYCTPN
jgi:hypothetical protein